MALQPDSPLHLRLGGYLLERFPPVAYTLLTVLFFGSGAWVAIGLGGGELRAYGWAGAVITWLVFLHLRIFDEHKDARQDLGAHPERLLSRGVVSLKLLRIVALLGIGAEALLAIWLGDRVWMAWGATFVFTCLMAVEFGLGRWLSKHLVIYAITHNPVVALLGIVAWACTTASLSAHFLWYLGAVSLGSLAFEFGRKINLESEEIEGVPSYSSVLGREVAGWMLRGVLVAAAGLGLACCWDLGQVLLGSGPRVGGTIIIGSTVAGLALSSAGDSAKKVEGGATLALLGLMAGLWVAAW